MFVPRKWIAMAAVALALNGGLAAQDRVPARTGIPAVKLQPAPKQQDQDPAELRAMYKARNAKKLEKEFIGCGGWIIDWDVARERAKAERTLVQVSRMEDLRARLAKGEKGLEAELFLAELGLGKIGWEEASQKAKGFTRLTEAQQKELGQLLLDAEIKHLIGGVGRDEEKMLKAGKRIEEILASGRLPSPDVQSTLWRFVLRYADQTANAGLYGRAVAFIKKQYADNPRYHSYLERLDAGLAELQASGTP